MVGRENVLAKEAQLMMAFVVTMPIAVVRWVLAGV
jgi:hypothetical protein